ncbi:MAG: FecCD family ABC transporter permease [Salipiger marinus]|uniref:FecCD family ABC transporter permease n=1 Tax=Salipiger marinus TaxID=555512 RepID=UPI004059F54B
MIRTGLPLAALLCLGLVSLLVGAGGVLPPGALATLGQVDPADSQTILLTQMRLPRTLAALLAGGALGAAGAVIQSLTRNPLAEPGLLGVNAGAALGIIGTLWLGGAVSGLGLIAPAAAGAAVVSGLILALGLRLDTGLGLILGGAALAGMATAVLRGMILLDPFAFDAWRGWIVGSVAAVDAPTLAAGALLVLPGAALAAAAAQKLDAMAMGDEAARALGTSLLLARALSLGAVALLSAGAVILAGPLVFVGLIAPQLARGRGEARTGLLTFRAALLGAALVLAADVAGRVAIPGLSIPIGLSAALIGGPLVIWQMTRRLQA